MALPLGLQLCCALCLHSRMGCTLHTILLISSGSLSLAFAMQDTMAASQARYTTYTAHRLPACWQPLALLLLRFINTNVQAEWSPWNSSGDGSSQLLVKTAFTADTTISHCRLILLSCTSLGLYPPYLLRTSHSSGAAKGEIADVVSLTNQTED